MLLGNVLDTKGEGGLFGNLGTKLRVLVHYKVFTENV